jgi:hypothetical protein
MDLPLNKFKMLVESKRWNLPSVQDAKLEAQIFALTAKFEYFKANKSLKEVKSESPVSTESQGSICGFQHLWISPCHLGLVCPPRHEPPRLAHLLIQIVIY